MPTDRRYSDDEVSRIFAKALEGPQPPARQTAADGGFTLAELQQIGAEAGIAPDAVAHAARSLDAPPPAAPRRAMGLPIRVERTVNLGRRLTDAEWEQLVVRLREVFDARGSVREHGSFRQWTNGNLQALLEPTETGHRLRLRTTKASARTGVGGGLVLVVMSAAMASSGLVWGNLASVAPATVTVGLIGAGILAMSALPLRAWARLRAQQMDDIAEWLAGENDDAQSSPLLPRSPE